MQLPKTIDDIRIHFEEFFQSSLADFYNDDSRLHQACRYAIQGEGKRVRPILTALSYRCFAEHGDHWLRPACSIEMIHTYSLVHDDLPCMDDDELRRGRPTTHVAFNEATALLVGDALLSDAFQMISGDSSVSAESRLAMIESLSLAIGGQGMVLGQDLDMKWTNTEGYQLRDLDQIHRLKTGALIRSACELGALAAGADRSSRSKLSKAADSIGLAFQIQDDLIDVISGIGKSTGKDSDQGKLTYLQIMSADDARKKVKDLTEEAVGILKSLGSKGDLLSEFMSLLVSRQS